MKKGKIRAKIKLINNIGYEFVRLFLKIFILLVCFPKLINKNKLPKKGGFILAGTHTGYIDSMLVGSLTLRPVHFVAKKELMDTPVLGAILRFAGLISVDRKKKNPDAKSEMLEALEADKIVCIFPEGTINRTKGEKEILPFKFGAVSIAQKSGKPIIPFAIADAKVFNYKARIIVGDPIYVGKDDDLEKANSHLEKEVVKLLREVKKNGK